ncbi:MAG TPA: NADPH-dependent FMN reductase [Streptomyces sp.]|uniref:NADPH-dependent FMN reductase n=1 Tax=Streptomyces sp. TaxID=1931 RepID=UPI002D698C29|nr:NADPH-dependent FMN reductase [Streptomyces sp.]HZG06119.1 NADPH-dependent FMN reductase [Streptomyces sp.]
MSTILALSGSPSRDSRTALLVEQAIIRLSATGYDADHLVVRELPAADLLAGRADAPRLRDALDQVAAADGLIVATPVYKASYSGLLKAFLDLLPQAGLAGKTVLPLVTGGSIAHVLSLDYALRPVLAALGARHVVNGCFLLDKSIERQPDGTVRLVPEAELRLFDVLDDFINALPLTTALDSTAVPLL